MIDRNAQEWMPCPLCGAQMEETTVGSVRHPGDDCPLAQIVLFDVDDCREAWNRRQGTDRIKALEDAAQAVVDRWDSPLWGGSALNLKHTGEYIARLRAALAASQPAPDCHQQDLVTVDSIQPVQHVAWRWKPKDGTVWRYDPCPEWLARQSLDEIDAEAIYTAPQPLTVQDAARVLWAAYKELRGKDWKDCTEAERDIKIMDSAALRAIAEGRA